MGKIGRFIDGLTEEQHDRIVEGRSWITGIVLGRDGSRCLLGHVCDIQPKDVMEWASWRDGPSEFTLAAKHRLLGTHKNVPVGNYFDDLVARFGLARVVRAIKLRAAAVSSREVEQPASEVVAR